MIDAEQPALTFNAYHLGGPGQGSREELDEHSQRRSGPESGALIHVRSGDMVVEALRQMRDNRVRSVLVIDDDVLVGIVTQGDCAIKVLLPGFDAKQTPVGQVMTGDPVRSSRTTNWKAAWQ